MSGDDLDFEALYRLHRNALFQLALRILRDRELAVDAVQESFAKAYESRKTFRGGSRPLTWLYRITYNTCLGKLRGKPRPSLDAGAVELEDDARGRPEPAAVREETRGLVRRALAKLSEEDRHILVLLMEKDMSYKELAYVLDCPAEPLRMRVCRARRRLREILEPILGRKP